jgi:beta-glucosidase
LHPFGYGLSYSKFEYDNIEVKKTGKNEFKIYVTVRNISDIRGAETVQLYIKGYGSSVRRRGKELKGFKKVFLEPNETKTVEFKLGFDELKIYSAKNRYEIESGKVKISVGSNPDLPLSAFIETEADN